MPWMTPTYGKVFWSLTAIGFAGGGCQSGNSYEKGTSPSIRRPPARNIEHRAGRERALLRGTEGDEIGDLLDLDEAAARDLRQHVGDVLLGHLVEQCGFRGR